MVPMHGSFCYAVIENFTIFSDIFRVCLCIQLMTVCIFCPVIKYSAIVEYAIVLNFMGHCTSVFLLLLLLLFMIACVHRQIVDISCHRLMLFFSCRRIICMYLLRCK